VFLCEILSVGPLLLLRILRVSLCPLDRLPARHRVSPEVGCHLDASRPACFSVGVCSLS